MAGNSRVGFWHYRLLIAEKYLPRQVRSELLDVVAQWHQYAHPGCNSKLTDKNPCKAIQVFLQGVLMAKVHRELVAMIATALDAEHLVRQEAWANGEGKKAKAVDARPRPNPATVR